MATAKTSALRPGGQLAHGEDLRKALRCQEGHQERLLRVQPVLRLVEDHGMGPIYDLRRLLHPARGGQAVHEDAIGLGKLHQLGVHLERHKHLLSRLLLILGNAVAHPAVAVDDVYVHDRLLGGLEDLDLGAGLGLQRLDLDPDLILDFPSASKVQVVAHESRGAHEVVCHIVLEIAEVGHGNALPATLVLDDCQQVRQHLHGVRVVVERVDDGDRGHLGQCADGVAAQDPRRDALAHARKHAASVLDALFHSQGRVADGVEYRVPSELVHPHLQRDARAQGGLLEEGQEGVALQRL
mmetsp:Transcript_98146/g.219923  ORF Transcript_98146/g.219923 Transcript_98146/m.219923 type:complete len:297 (-) Transcript_98146:310-1200(-)